MCEKKGAEIKIRIVQQMAPKFLEIMKNVCVCVLYAIGTVIIWNEINLGAIFSYIYLIEGNVLIIDPAIFVNFSQNL